MLELLMLVFGAFFATVAFLFSAAQKSHVRARAEESKDTLAYWAVKISDEFYRQTIFRKISLPRKSDQTPGGATKGKSVYMHTLHDYINADDMIDIRQAFSVSLDLSKRVPARWLSFLGNPANQILAKSIIACIAVALVAIPLSKYFSADKTVGILVALIIVASTPMIVIFSTIFLSEKSDGVLGVFQRLYFKTYVLVNIDNRMIEISSPWSRTVARNEGDIHFETVAKDFGFQVIMRSTGYIDTIIFMYPRVFGELILTESELQDFCSKLNALIHHVRSLQPADQQ
jgi:hypothetical protein